jgi:hypothetical protein
MLEAALSPLTKFAATYISVANALHVGSLKKIGLLKEGAFLFEETLGSSEAFNRRLDTNAQVPFLFHIVASANLTGFLDPTNEEYFLNWRITEDSYVTLPGLVENGPITRGSIRLKLHNYMEYAFEFASHDGREFFYRGVKDLKTLRVVKAWSTLTGSIHEKETENKIVESVVFSDQKSSLLGVIPILRSISFR